MNRSAHITISLACGIAVMAGLAGCRGERSDNTPRQFLPDMDDQPRFRPQQETTFFADGRIQRQPVAGTVAYATWPADFESEENAEWVGPWAEQRARLIREDDGLYFGVGPGSGEGSDTEDAAYWLDEIPVEVTVDLIKYGQERFNIFCAVCHGYAGEGGSGQTDSGAYGNMVGQRWSYPVPSFHDEKYQRDAGTGSDAVKTGRDGYLFHVIRNGVPETVASVYPYKMPPYDHALNEYDAWAVVAYVRTLQASRQGTMDDVPEAERMKLNESRGGTPNAAADTTIGGGDA